MRDDNRHMRVPSSSGNRSIPRFVWGQGGGCGGAGRSADVYGAADAGWGGCALPALWSLHWWDGSEWKPVEGVARYPTEKDKFNRVRFSPVRTDAIRLQVLEQGRQPAGILEWRISQ